MLDRYYYMASLPALGELGTEAPMGFSELLEHLSDSRQRYELVASLFLLDDLLQREAFLAGEIEEVDPAVLSIQQTRNESPLPEYLAGDGSGEAKASLGVAADRLWEAYFRYVFALAQRRTSEFLTAWVSFEVTLRNALVAARSKRLGLDGNEYLVATDLGASGDTLASLVSEWAAAATPLAGQQVLLRGRWAWLAENDAWFSFRDDELVAYAARLMLLRQWERIVAEAAGR